MQEPQSAALSETANAKPAASWIERYSVVRVLASTSAGRTELVSDLALDGEKVVRKFLAAHLLPDDESVQGLRRAVLAARQLAHSNIVRVFDFDRKADGDFYLTSEYVNGENLRTALFESGKNFVPLPTALETLFHVANGLAHAHSKGILHGDLRPENVIIGKQGETKITDFGIAACLQRGDGLTATGEMLGKVAYMAPELFSGGKRTFASDVYSFGVLAFELLLGRTPFQGKSDLDIASQHISSPFPALRSRRADVPEWLEQLIRDCGSKTPIERLADGRSILERLERYAQPNLSRDANTFVVYFRKRIRKKSLAARAYVLCACLFSMLLLMLALAQSQERIAVATKLLWLESYFDIDLSYPLALLNVNGSLRDPDSLANAISNRDTDSLHALLLAGANPKLRTRDGRRLADVVVSDGDIAVVQKLSEHNIRINGVDANGNTPFLNAMKQGNYRMLSALLGFQADFHTPDREGVTPLLLAAKRNQTAFAQSLITFKVDLDAQDSTGQSALHYAVQNNNVTLVVLLQRAGARLDIWNNQGRTPLMFAPGNPTLTHLLLALGANPQARDNEGSSALHQAVKVQDLTSVHKLLEAGAFRDTRDNTNKRPLDYARELGNNDLIAALEQGVTSNAAPSGGGT